jgi:hypothetical protein
MRTCKVLPLVGEACPDSVCRDEGVYCESTMKICTAFGLPGDPCSATARCSPFYTCDPATMVCAEGPAIGEPCGTSGVNRCFDFGTYCKAGTCAALEAVGAPCTNDNDCETDLCDTTTNVCAEEAVCI